MKLTDSAQPRKQRRAVYKAPLHARQKLVNVHLSNELKGTLGTARRAIAVRSGDKVKVVRGKFKGKTGTVSKVDLKRLKVFVEGAVRTKAKGGEVLVGLPSSKLVLVEAKMDDKRRKAVVDRSPKGAKVAPKPKPAAKKEAPKEEKKAEVKKEPPKKEAKAEAKTEKKEAPKKEAKPVKKEEPVAKPGAKASESNVQ